MKTQRRSDNDLLDIVDPEFNRLILWCSVGIMLIGIVMLCVSCVGNS
jgi:hypothetical protein